MAVIKNMMVRVGADVSGFTTQMTKASKSVKGLQTGVGQSLKGIQGAMAGLRTALGALGIGVGIHAIAGAVQEAKEAYDEASEASMKLATAMRNTMGARNEEIQSVLDLCEAQQRLGIIEDDTQVAGAQELATYLRLSDSLKTLIPAMTDMVAQQYGFSASAENAVNIATMMGKVMEGQTGALRRYGYYFTEAEEAILKYGTESERAATLAGIIEQSVGGMNQALAQTPTGRQQQLANTLGDVKEQFGAAARAVGTLFLPLMWKAAEALGSVAAWAERAANSLGRVFGTAPLLTDWKTVSIGVSGYGDAWEDTADAASDAGDAVTAAGKAASEARNKILGFDELNILGDDVTASAGSGSLGAGAGLGDLGIGDIAAALPSAMQGLLDKEVGDIPWLTNLVQWMKDSYDSAQPRRVAFKLAIKDVLFDWKDLNPEQIAQKAISGLGVLLGAGTGFMLGGVPGAIVGTLLGLGLTLVADSAIFDHDGVLDRNEIASMLEIGLNGLVGGAIGFAVGGPAGALLGATIGVGVTLLAKTIESQLGEKGQKILSGIVDGLNYGIAGGVGGVLGFMVGGPGGAAIGLLAGLGITFAIGKLKANYTDGDNGRSKYKSGAAWFLCGVLGMPTDEEVNAWFAQLGRDLMEDLRVLIINPVLDAFDSIRGLWDRLKSWWSNLTLGAINIKMPHFSWSWQSVGGVLSVPKISVDWYARGGVFDSPSVIGVGEAGKEAVVPLERNAGWIDQVAGSLADRLDRLTAAGSYGSAYRAPAGSGGGPEAFLAAFGGDLMRAMESREPSRPVTTIFKVGEREFARATYDARNAVKKEKGFSLISNFT